MPYHSLQIVLFTLWRGPSSYSNQNVLVIQQFLFFCDFLNVLLLLTFDEIAQNTLASMSMWEIFSHIAVKVFGVQQLTIGLELSPESGLRCRF